jgi:hypothetical protein
VAFGIGGLLGIEAAIANALAIFTVSLVRSLRERRRGQKPARERRDGWAFRTGFWLAKQAHRLRRALLR